MIVLILHQINMPLVLLDLSTLILLGQCPQNLDLAHIMSSHLLTIIQALQLLCFYTPRMLSLSISNQWFLGLRPLWVICSPLYIQTKRGGLWLECFSRSSSPEALHIKPLFLTPLSRMVVQRGSIELCLRQQEPFTNTPVCHVLSGRRLLRLHCIFIIDNKCVVMNGRHPLNNSVETNLMFHI